MLQPKFFASNFFLSSAKSILALIVPAMLLVPLSAAQAAPAPVAASEVSVRVLIHQAFNIDANSVSGPGSLWVVVNKKRPLSPATYKPKHMVQPGFDSPKKSNPMGLTLRKDAAKAMAIMDHAMFKDIAQHIVLASTYRSYSSQKSVHDKVVKRLGKTAGENLAARPGYSEHQTGLAADVSATGSGCYIQVCFAKKKAGKWLASNSWKYGYVLRYRKYHSEETGYQFEPWHFRFVGVDLSTEYHSRGAPSLENFFELPNAPTY
jgi:D-alanyl-D-alanine carboxypeptidase